MISRSFAVAGLVVVLLSSMVPAASLFNQPVDAAGVLHQSSRMAPNGSYNDKYVWDNFALPSAGTISEVAWTGGFDLAPPDGGPVINFEVAIYASRAAGLQPDVLIPPLVKYQTGGNAGQTPAGTVNGIPMYYYRFTLPAPFMAAAGEIYWLHIIAEQYGIPDWGLVRGTGGDAKHFRKFGSGGDYYYQTGVPGDMAFMLLEPGGPAPITAAFSAVPSSGSAPLSVAFTNQSTGDYATSLWRFGDGVTSGGISPTHTFMVSGTYSINLTVSGPGGTDTATRAAYIHVISAATMYLPVITRAR